MKCFQLRPVTCLAILSLSVLTGCGTQTATSENSPEGHHENDGHDHAAGGHSHIGPHNGHLIELGSNEEYHAELVHDEATHRVTVYILDGEAKKNVPISQPELIVNMVSSGAPQQFKLAAVTQGNELPNMASCFQLEDQALCDALDASGSKGRLAVDINGKRFVGEIEQHDDEDHKGGAENKAP